jgi:hypothetical protein
MATEKQAARLILKKIVESIFSVALKNSTSKLLTFFLTGIPGTIAMAIFVKLLEGLATIGVQLTMNAVFFSQVDGFVKKDLDFYNEKINEAYGIVFSKTEISEWEKDRVIDQIKLATDRLVSMRDYVN